MYFTYRSVLKSFDRFNLQVKFIHVIFFVPKGNAKNSYTVKASHPLLKSVTLGKPTNKLK